MQSPLEERFLVLAPTGRDAALTVSLLERAGLAAAKVASLAEMCATVVEHGGAALLIAEEVFARDGLEPLTQMLAKQSSWSDLPIVIFTGNQASFRPHARSPQELCAIGNVILMERPLQPVSMLSAARSALRARRRQYAARADILAQQRAVRERDQFLAMLGHELRNPLAALSMAIHLDGEVGWAKSRDIMSRQIGNLTRLVDDLLDVARVTSGKITLQREPLELVALTQRCINVLSSSMHSSLSLRLVEPPAQLWVDVDSVRIEQVVNNLLTNAIKYTDNGGSVEVRLRNEGGEAVIRVRDTGVGLAPDMVERVFELFTQVPGSLDRAKGGMGIGLTLVRNLVGLHGGTVTASSAGLGHGSEFVVRLPGARDAAPADARPQPSAASEQPAPSRSVLIVEDNEDSRELLAAILTTRGYGVFTADNGLRGVEEAITRQPDVLLVDIGLPGLDGYGLAREVRKQLGRDVYMVALTGYGQPEDRARAAEAGFDVHLTKPVDIHALERLLADQPQSARA